MKVWHIILYIKVTIIGYILLQFWLKGRFAIYIVFCDNIYVEIVQD